MSGSANTGTGRPSIVLARAPLRVSLAGGGTDLPSWAALLRAGVHRNVQITVCTDAPSGTGLGGSGAFTVALRHAQRPTPAELAEEASTIAIVDLERPVGKHDHYMAAFGRIRVLHIEPTRRVTAEELPVSQAVRRYIRDRLLLLYTGLSRDAGQTLTEQDRSTRHGDVATMASLHAIGALARPMTKALYSGRVDEVGPLMHEHWSNKQRLGDGISNPRIDKLYQIALAAGSDGGKILGAGGGGFLLLSARANRVDELRAAMAAEGLRELAFGIDRTGSRAARLPA